MATPTTSSTESTTPTAPSQGSYSYQLVIVESPAKAKTIERYLGRGFVVRASVGHIRDLPKKSPKGTTQAVPGIDLDTLEPTYVIPEKRMATVADLRRLAANASAVWFATDLDREGEAIAWHLAVVLGIDPLHAKRVTFNAVTKADVQEAFKHPRPIDMNRVNAQQARRLLDRLVGYMVSPVLWRKVAGGLSAGRVQTPAARLIVDRERGIAAFRPNESWGIHTTLNLSGANSAVLGTEWAAFCGQRDPRGRGPLVRERVAWLAQRAALECELVEVAGKPFKVEADAASAEDLTLAVADALRAVGLEGVTINIAKDEAGRGRAANRVTITGTLDPKARYAVSSVETTRTRSKPSPPFITSTLQQAAAGRLGLATDGTMSAAQHLFDALGWITYHRTDSVQLSPEAISRVRGFIKSEYGEGYLPESPRHYPSKPHAQEAHGAICPTDLNRTPESLKGATNEVYLYLRLYTLIWRQFVASQMVDAEWESTEIRLERSDQKTGAVLKAAGRVLARDGFYRAAGVPQSDSEQTLPPTTVGAVAAPFFLEATQKFSSPPPRFTEATLVRALEATGLGRPSTYATIVKSIQTRKYVEQVDRRFYATDLGMAVVDFLVHAFATNFVELDYTRRIEQELDEIAQGKKDWKAMLKTTHAALGPLIELSAQLPHVKSVLMPAKYACPKCGSRTEYRLGKHGRFLSCSSYPTCRFANQVDREGTPLVPAQLDLLSPTGRPMVMRQGRFGPFIIEDVPPPALPYTKGMKAKPRDPRETSARPFTIAIDKEGRIEFRPPPLVTDRPCPKCQSPLNLRAGRHGPRLACSRFPDCRGRAPFGKLAESIQGPLTQRLASHVNGHAGIVVTRRNGTPVAEGTPVADLIMPGGDGTLPIHPDAGG